MKRVKRRLGPGEGGFTMVVTLVVLVICAALTAAAFGSVVNDIPLRKESRVKKQAYAAAEAGLNFYLSRLNQDNEYWAKCTAVAPPNGSEPSPVNQPWDGAGADPRQKRQVPGSNSSYTIELLPAVGSQCQTSNPGGTMLDPATGTFRIRATGFANGEKRSIIASLRRKSFLDYLYFTDYETTDPLLYGNYASSAQDYCGEKYRASRPVGCREITFSAADRVNGPFHTNDDILTCNGSTFGRTPADRIEASGPKPGWKNNCGSSAPNFLSTWQAGVSQLPPPENNGKIASVAVAPYILTGTNILYFNDHQVTVYPQRVSGGTPQFDSGYNLPMPPNGVIYVKNGAGCGAPVSQARQDYSDPVSCANVYVAGRYADSLTVVSDKDVIIGGDVTRADDTDLLGLIATNSVRVYHPVTNRVLDDDGTNKSCTNATGTLQNVRIDAAILALQHSFVVDNYDCGAALGTLTVNGAIAQTYRGPVATTAPTGYTKNYGYDDRLKYRNPPYFLDPVSAAWRVLRTNEQVPAR